MFINLKKHIFVFIHWLNPFFKTEIYYRYLAIKNQNAFKENKIRY